MTLHLIKMAAGIDRLETLEERQAFLRQQSKARTGRAELLHVTRYFPKRADEILGACEDEGVSAEDLSGVPLSTVPVSTVPGSLYWVFQKSVQARQRIKEFRAVEDTSGVSRCAIVLEGPLVRVERQHRKAFQGWRYLTELDAPADIDRNSYDAALIADEKLADMRDALQELCLI